MMNIDLNKREQALMRKGQKSLHWSCSWWWSYLLCLFPAYLIASRIYMFYRGTQDFSFVLALRLGGDLHAVPISVFKIECFITLLLFVPYFFLFFQIAQIWRERRTFFTIIERLESKIETMKKDAQGVAGSG